MRTETSLESAVHEYHDDPEYILEGLLYDLTEQIVQAMQRQRVSRADLAERLGVSRAYVTQLLRGKPNTTLRTLVRVAAALGLKLQASLVRRASSVRLPRSASARGRRPAGRV